MSKPEKAGTSGGKQEEINVNQLDPDKIRSLMRRDPKFIGRLITQLDSQMHKMMADKMRRRQQIEADRAAIQSLDDQINQHIVPNLTQLNKEIADKEVLRAHLQLQLDTEMKQLKDLAYETAAITSKARHAGGRLTAQTARNSLLEQRGFTATTPTTELLKAKPRTTLPASPDSQPQ